MVLHKKSKATTARYGLLPTRNPRVGDAAAIAGRGGFEYSILRKPCPVRQAQSNLFS